MCVDGRLARLGRALVSCDGCFASTCRRLPRIHLKGQRGDPAPELRDRCLVRVNGRLTCPDRSRVSRDSFFVGARGRLPALHLYGQRRGPAPEIGDRRLMCVDGGLTSLHRPHVSRDGCFESTSRRFPLVQLDRKRCDPAPEIDNRRFLGPRRRLPVFHLDGLRGRPASEIGNHPALGCNGASQFTRPVAVALERELCRLQIEQMLQRLPRHRGAVLKIKSSPAAKRRPESKLRRREELGQLLRAGPSAIEGGFDNLPEAILARSLQIGRAKCGESFNKLLQRFCWTQHKVLVGNKNAWQVLGGAHGVTVVHFPKGDSRRCSKSIARSQRTGDLQRISKDEDANRIRYGVP